MLEFGLGSRSLTVALAVGVVLSLIATVPLVEQMRLPGDDQGYTPEQPIAFSHRLHAGDMEISCIYCHQGAETSRHAGVPATSTCMNCHQFVTSSLAAFKAEDAAAKAEGREPRQVVAPDLRKLYDSLGLGEDLKAKPTGERKPIAWVGIHRLPDHAYFPHSRHVNAGVACQTCHGPIEKMERVRQDAKMTMGWCVNCHRLANETGVGGKPAKASTDCAACHY